MMPIREVIRLPTFNGLRFSWLPEVIPASPVVGSWSAYAWNGGAVMNLFHSGVALYGDYDPALRRTASKCSPNRDRNARQTEPVTVVAFSPGRRNLMRSTPKPR